MSKSTRMHSKLALVVAIVVIAVVAVVLPAWAHHAHGNYANEMTDFEGVVTEVHALFPHCLLYTSPSPRDGLLSRMPSSA